MRYPEHQQLACNGHDYVTSNLTSADLFDAIFVHCFGSCTEPRSAGDFQGCDISVAYQRQWLAAAFLHSGLGSVIQTYSRMTMNKGGPITISADFT